MLLDQINHNLECNCELCVWAPVLDTQQMLKCPLEWMNESHGMVGGKGKIDICESFNARTAGLHFVLLFSIWIWKER